MENVDQGFERNKQYLSNISTLLLDECGKMTDVGMYELCGYHQLNALAIEETTLMTDCGFEQLSRLSRLEVLTLNHIDGDISSYGIVSSLEKIPKLKALTFYSSNPRLEEFNSHLGDFLYKLSSYCETRVPTRLERDPSL